MRCTATRGTGLWLLGGGLVLLAASYGASRTAPVSAIDASALHVGMSGGSLLLGVGLLLLVGFQGGSGPARSDALKPGQPEVPNAPCGRTDDVATDLAREFDEWLDRAAAGEDAWNAFDQFVREMLGRHAGAQGVRCFAVEPKTRRLRSLSAPGAEDAGGAEGEAAGPLARAIADGIPYFAQDRRPGGDANAVQDPRRAVVWPVVGERAVIGLITIGAVEPGGAESLARTSAVLTQLTLLWRFVALRARLETARVIDRATGVLTRDEFFAKAREALDESAGQGEPVAVAALMLEGLRGLDDRGLWAVRDALVEEVGRALLAKLRSDDVVGRLSDDRFVFLMRRIDTTLGRLIAGNIMEDVRARIAQRPEFDGRVGVRLGLVGGSLPPPGLDALLATAWRAVEQARSRGELLHAHTGAPRAAGGDA